MPVGVTLPHAAARPATARLGHGHGSAPPVSGWAFRQFHQVDGAEQRVALQSQSISLAVCIAAVLVREVVGRRHERRMQTPSLITWLLV